jgi:hypothetical protein
MFVVPRSIPMIKLPCPENLRSVGRLPPLDSPAPISVVRPSRMRASTIRETVGALRPLFLAKAALEIPLLSRMRLITLVLLISLMSLAFPAWP